MDCSPSDDSFSNISDLMSSGEDNDSDYQPFNTRLEALLFMLLNSPQPIGESSLKFIFYTMKTLDPSIPSLNVLKRFKLPEFIPPVKYTAANGIDFYCNLPSTVLKQCFGNPEVASMIVRYPEVSHSDFREFYHAKKWHIEFPAPMTFFQDSHIFVNDFVRYTDVDGEEYVRKVKRIFTNEGNSEVMMEVHVLLSYEQLQKTYPQIGVLNSNESSLILSNDATVPITVILGTCEIPQHILSVVNYRLVAMNHQEYCDFIEQHPLKVASGGLQVVFSPFVIFTDDTSGNKSKKWNKFDYWCISLACLPISEARKFPNIHFLCCSNQLSSIEIADPIVEDLVKLESGIVVYDAFLLTEVYVIAPVIAVLCDNARASELVNHLGSRAKKFCRKCNAKPGDAVIGALRSKSQSLQQIEEIKHMNTDAERKAKRTEYGLKETYNPLFELKIDLYRSTPVETLHTILLGASKYMLRATMNSLNVHQKKEILARIRAWCYCGFVERVTGNIAYHYKSFVGRDFKTWLQMVLFIIPTYVSDQELKCWFSLVKLFRCVYCLHPNEAVIADISRLSEEFHSLITQYSPEYSRRLKVHILLHLADDIRLFGPATLFNTERFESYNSLMRNQNIHSNRQSPSKDIATSFAVLQHLRFMCSGGKLTASSNVAGSDLQSLYSDPQVQQFINFGQAHYLYSTKAMYQPNTLRKLKHGSKSILLRDILFKACIWKEDWTMKEFVTTEGYSCNFQSMSLSEDSLVIQYGAIVGRSKELVNVGSFVELKDCTFSYGILLAIIKSNSPPLSICAVWLLKEVISLNGSLILTDFDCPLLSLSNNVNFVSSASINKSISVAHQCNTSCSMNNSDFHHDYSNRFFSLNIYCIGNHD